MSEQPQTRSNVTLKRHARGDYRTPDGEWRVVNPYLADNGDQRTWIIQGRDGDSWFALDGGFRTLREARGALDDELAITVVDGGVQ